MFILACHNRIIYVVCRDELCAYHITGTLDKEIASAASSELEQLMKQRKELEEQLTYVLYYPKNMKYVGLFVGELDQKNLNIISKAKMAAFKARSDDISNGRPDRVRSCLGREVSFNEVDESDVEIDTEIPPLKIKKGTLKYEVFQKSKSNTVQSEDARLDGMLQENGNESGDEEDAFFADNDGEEPIQGDKTGKKSSQNNNSSAKKKKFEGREDRGSSARYAKGSKQGDRLSKWQHQHKAHASSFISVHKSSPTSHYEQQTYSRTSNKNDTPRMPLRSNNNISSRSEYTKDRRPSASTTPRSSYSRPQREQQQTQSTRSVSSWETAPGVSASAGGERNRQKQIGLIVPGAGTKRKFAVDE